MRLEELSVEANQLLLDYLETHLKDLSPVFQEDVLYAVSIAAPLRERTYLVRLAAEISGVEWATVEPFAFAAELFIISALTADDAIDGANTRSGEPSLFCERGFARSILVAEWLHAIAQIVLWSKPNGINDKTWSIAVKKFHAVYSAFFVSQYLESHEEGNHHVTLEEIDKLSRDRTGGLLEACLVSPAIISASEELTVALAECGKWLGMAFQHRDDILDFIAAPEVIGKPILLNLLDGQPNLVLSHVLAKATDESSRNVILKYFGTRCIDKDGEEHGNSIQREVLEALRACGALDYARQVVEDYSGQAVNAISDLPFSQAKEELVKIIDVVACIEFPWEGAE